MHWLAHLLGTDSGNGPFYLFGSGSGGKIIDLAVGILIGWLGKRVFTRVATRISDRHHAQAERHHQEKLAQAGEHHRAALKQAERHHVQRLDQAAEHHEALKEQLRPPTLTGKEM